MRLFTAATLALLSAFVATPQSADAQEACSFYRVQKGDTLREIAEAAFGWDNHQAVWRMNRTQIGRNPNVIEIGMVLRMPCLEGQEMVNETPAVSDGEAVSFVTANGFLPYTDESLPHQGMITDLVRMAMTRAASEQPVEVVFVNDWASHLEELLPRGAFDASFPWTAPACDAGEDRDPHCDLYAYSDPIYQVVDGFFSKAGVGLENVIAFEGFEGATICRPEGYTTAHLKANGLSEPFIRMVQPASSHACFEMLMNGTVDLVALDTRAGEHVMADLGLSFQVVENPHLFSIQPLQVAVLKDNPKSSDLIEDLNRGLRVMLESGEWASIVTEGLSARPKALVN